MVDSEKSSAWGFQGNPSWIQQLVEKTISGLNGLRVKGSSVSSP